MGGAEALNPNGWFEMEVLRQLAAEIFELQAFVPANLDQDLEEVTVILSVPNSTVAVLKIDGRFVPRNAGGVATVQLEPGHHVMAWRVYAAPESEYTVGILAPPEAAWKPEPPMRTDSDGFGGNEFEFDI